MKKQLIRAAATTVLGLSLTTGFAAAATGDISNTGPNSTNHVRSHVTNSATVANHNDLRATNNNTQTSRTGEAEAEHNTTAGDATSGSASNDNSLSASVSVDNSAGSAWLNGMSSGGDNSGTIHTTGPSSRNAIESTVTNTLHVTNTNNLTVSNTNHQTATSGDASVENNTTGGSATTGDASNSNSTMLDFSVTN